MVQARIHHTLQNQVLSKMISDPWCHNSEQLHQYFPIGVQQGHPLLGFSLPSYPLSWLHKHISLPPDKGISRLCNSLLTL